MTTNDTTINESTEKKSDSFREDATRREWKKPVRPIREDATCREWPPQSNPRVETNDETSAPAPVSSEA